MPIETHWANNIQSILIEKFHDVWTWHQVSEACQTKIHPLLHNMNQPIVLIQDMIGSHWTPTTNLLQDVQETMQTPCPENIVMVVVVSGNPAIDTLLVSAYKRAGQQSCIYQACPTVNQAIRVAGDYLSLKD